MNNTNVFDGHIHSLYCPHGTVDTFKMYIEKAINLGYKEMSFTEHAPLPPTFSDPVPDQDSAITMEQLELYIDELTLIKKIYSNDILINIGLEIDYIEGLEEDTKLFLDEWGPYLDDAMLSVHFLKCNDKFRCLDYSPEEFKSMMKEHGSLENLYKSYYKTLLHSITSNLGIHKPRRIGHITLVRKFQRLFPRDFDDSPNIITILDAIKKQNLSLDINGAGLVKPHCQEFYPPLYWAKKAMEMGIPIVYGSDAHQAEKLGSGLDQFLTLVD